MLLIGLLGVAAWLRLHDLGGQSLWWDEVMSWRQAKLGLADLLAVTAEDNYPPLHNLILHYWLGVLGDGEAALRLPSAMLGLATVGATYWVGRQLGGVGAGLIAAGLLAISGFHIWYSGEARMYALLGCAATVFAGTGIAVVVSGRWPWAVAHLLAAVALLYSHAYGGITWAAIAAGLFAVLLRRRDWGRAAVLLGLEAAALLMFVPWLLVLFARATDIGRSGFWIPALTPWSLFQMLVQLASGPFMLAVIAVGIRVCLTRRVTGRRWAVATGLDGRDAAILLLAWALLPVAAGVLLSLAIGPILLSRYLIGALPALLLLAGLGFSVLAAGSGRRLALAGLTVAGITGLATYAPGARDDFRGVAAYLEAELSAGDCVVMIPEAQFALGYYMDVERLPCAATARHMAEARLPMPPTRVLALATLDADTSGIDRLGQEVARKEFGPTQLIVLLPPPGADAGQMAMPWAASRSSTTTVRPVAMAWFAAMPVRMDQAPATWSEPRL